MELILGADPMASWWFAVTVVALVIVVVALLLHWVIRTAGAIDREVATIWAGGQRVANNTIHIAALYKTLAYAQGISGRAGRILASSTALRNHAKDCTGCPKCIGRNE